MVRSVAGWARNVAKPGRMGGLLTSFILLGGVAMAALPCVAAESAPGGPSNRDVRALFAYGDLPVLDRYGKPVIDRKSGKPKRSGFCQLWKPSWPGGTKTLNIIAGRDWWTRYTMRIDVPGREINIVRVWGPNVEALPDGGWRPAGPPTEIRWDLARDPLVMKMYDAPRPEWPCVDETWDAQLRAERKTIVRVPRGGSKASHGSSGGGFHFPERSILNPCRYTNGHIVPNCH